MNYGQANEDAKAIWHSDKPWPWNSFLAAKLVSLIPPGIYCADAFIAEGAKLAQWKNSPERNWPMPSRAEGGYVVVIPDRKQSLVEWRREMLHGRTMRIATHIVWCEDEADALLTHLRFGTK